ncbi:MAG: hypothetical protein WCC27_10215 [Acidobacteriaceae bacterium]
MALAAPLPTIAERRHSRLWGIPVYWHLLSLDAPTVAVLWAWGLARTARVQSDASVLAVLGVGTWLLYVADRLLDGRPRGHRPLRERHFFHARYRTAFLTASTAAALLLLALIGLMPPRAGREDALVFAASMLYFAIVHLPGLSMQRWFPRELAVGALFACATTIPAWSASGSPRAELTLPVFLFAGLCCLNCVAIETWERSANPDRNHAVPALAICLALASATPMLIPSLRSPSTFRLLASAFASATLLFALDRLHRRVMQPDAAPATVGPFLLVLRVAADAALLTPLLFLLPWRP